MREEVITVASTELNEYGDLMVTTPTRVEPWKIKKRLEKLHPLFEVGRAVKLTIKRYKEYDYVDNAELFNPGGQPEVLQQEQPPVCPTTNPPLAPRPQPAATSRSDEIAQHVWWKEAGETLRRLSPELQTHPMYVDLKNAYLKKMFSVLGITMRHE